MENIVNSCALAKQVDAPKDWIGQRIAQYHLRIDPFFQEAQMDALIGDPTKAKALANEYLKIKKEIPKPV